MTSYEILSKLEEVMTTKQLLDEIVNATSEVELVETLEYIAKMNGVELEEEGAEEC